MLDMKLIERDGYLRKLIDVMGTPDIKVITGVRRSGKSKLMERFKAYILEQNDNANIIHINFNMKHCGNTMRSTIILRSNTIRQKIILS